MADSCTKLTSISDKCSKCGAAVLEVHKTGPMFRRRFFCASCCPACNGKSTTPTVAKPPKQDAHGCGYGPPRGPDGRYLDPKDDAFYRDEQRHEWINEHSPRGEARWIPRRDWFRGRR